MGKRSRDGDNIKGLTHVQEEEPSLRRNLGLEEGDLRQVVVDRVTCLDEHPQLLC